LRNRTELTESEEALVIGLAEIYRTAVTPENLGSLDGGYLGPDRSKAVEALVGRGLAHKWQLREALTALSYAWKAREASPLTEDYNEQLSGMYNYLFRHLHRQDE
jgi:hypothetical protein